MMLPLITFVKPDSHNSAFSSKLVEATTQILANNFSSFPVFCPFFVSGSMRKDSLLGALLQRLRPDIVDAGQCFECGEEAADGLYVWPEPVHINGETLMLLKLKAPTSDTAEYMDQMKKVMMEMPFDRAHQIMLQEEIIGYKSDEEGRGSRRVGLSRKEKKQNVARKMKFASTAKMKRKQ